MSKAKAKVKAPKAQAKTSADDEDFDAILNAAKAEMGIPLEPEPPQPPPATDQPSKSPVPPEAPGDDEDDEDEDGDAGAGGGGDKKDKKKKKKKDKKKVPEKKEEKGLSAHARMILERQKALQEEEERLKKLREEEERRRAEEEARIEEEIRRKEEEKRLKKEKQKAKVDKAKQEGTYMTKAQKEKAARARAALEQMRALGLVDIAAEGEGGEAPPQKKKPLYGKKTKKGGKDKEGGAAAQEGAEVNGERHGDDDDAPTIGADAEAATADEHVLSAAEGPAGGAEDSWEDWEAGAEESLEERVSKLTASLPKSNSGGWEGRTQEDEEDEIRKEREREQEKYRQLGLARLKREEEERARQELMKQQEEDEDRQRAEAQYRKEESRRRRLAREETAFQNRSKDKLRSPICCIMGHVDTGKTKLLDNIRRTNVQEGEAGGITQQIGATFFPRTTIETRTGTLNKTMGLDIKLPGLLIIDTPGHESFTNLRSRGSSLCDIAILVIDLMHGLEPQTIESINLLRRKKTPFVVALNKVDRCYGWKVAENGPIRPSLDQQDENTKREFEDRTERIIVQLKEQGLNSELYWKNTDPARTVSLVPTSAITGEGVPDLLLLLCRLTQDRMAQALMYVDVVQCTILEVKQLEGLGTTVDVVLVNGTLHEGDTIVVCTMDGPVITTIRALLTPPPSREMRVGHQFVHHPKIEAAMGIKIVATGLEKTVAGTGLMVIGPEDEPEDIKEEVMRDITSVMGNLETDNKGVTVQASTLGALEALLEFLRKECNPPVPVARVGIGPIFKKDVTQTGINIEKGLKEYAVILAFDVKVDSEAKSHAEDLGVRIFTADIIYHLFDQFQAYMGAITEQRKQEAMALAVFPVVLKIFPQHVFNAKDPIVLGVEIVRGILKLGTPLCATSSNGMVDVGVVQGIESNHKEQTQAQKGATVAVKIVNEKNPTITYGRQFDASCPLYSKLSRESIDALKAHFKSDLATDDWRLVIDLKKVFGII